MKWGVVGVVIAATVANFLQQQWLALTIIACLVLVWQITKALSRRMEVQHGYL